MACLFFRFVPAFFARPQLPRQSPPFFSRSPAFFARPQLPRKFPPLPFYSSLAPNYRESPPLFSSLARFFRTPPTTERVPAPLFFLARPQLPRAWNRLSENLQSSCLFSTQCLRIEKSVLLAFDRDQYYVLPNSLSRIRKCFFLHTCSLLKHFETPPHKSPHTPPPRPLTLHSPVGFIPPRPTHLKYKSSPSSENWLRIFRDVSHRESCPYATETAICGQPDQNDQRKGAARKRGLSFPLKGGGGGM